MNYYFLVSGGRDSTAMVLQHHDEGKKGELVYGDTRLNSPAAKKVVERLAAYVNWPLHVVRYEGDKKPIVVLRESFMKIPQAIAYMKKTGKFRRNMFKCCDTLKHRPMNEYIKALSEHFIRKTRFQRLLIFLRIRKERGEACLVLGLKGSDSAIHRIYRMRQLRELDTFYRRHKSNGVLYYYPLRDATDSDVQEILDKHGFGDTHSSGCTICPIFCMFESWRKKDPDAWRRSVQFANLLGIDFPAKGQTFIPELCKEVS